MDIDAFSSNYDNLILLGDFNVETAEKHMKDFSLIYNCKNFVMDKTCYKNLENPKYIDPIMTNILKSFQNSLEIETELSDFSQNVFNCIESFLHQTKITYYSISKL